MPNYCQNLIEVKKANNSEEAQVEYAALLSRFADSFLLAAVLPTPAGVANTADWCAEHWGTKWDVEEDTFFWVASEGLLRSGFSTVWSPPRPVVRELSNQYPNLEFTHGYIETSEGFAGLDRYIDGEHTEELYEDDGLTDETREMSWFHAEQMEGYENPFERDDDSDEIEEE